MKSVGDTLQTLRERKKLTLQSVSEMLHIRPEYLEAIEADQFHLLPTDVAARGFISLYAELMGVSAKTLLALYRRDVKVPIEQEFKLNPTLFSWNNRRNRRITISAVFGGALLSGLIYAGVIMYQFSQAPTLSVRSPKVDAQVTSPVTVRGSTLTDAVVTVDGSAIGVNQDGEFVESIELNPGPHIVTIKAIGRNSKESVRQINFTVEEK